jgi:hypothetical protein
VAGEAATVSGSLAPAGASGGFSLSKIENSSDTQTSTQGGFAVPKLVFGF